MHPLPNSARRLVTQLEDKLKDVEHWTVTDPKNPRMRIHYAVAIQRDGKCGLGRAACASADQYDRKIGYRIAVGRALRQLALNTYPMEVDVELEGRDLYLAVRRQVDAITDPSLFLSYRWQGEAGKSPILMSYTNEKGQLCTIVGVPRPNASQMGLVSEN